MSLSEAPPTTSRIALASSTMGSTSLSREAQIELGTKIFLGKDPIKSFGPYMLGMWFDAIMLGLLICMFAEWIRKVYRTERMITKLLMIYLLIISISVSCYVLTCQFYLFVSGFGVYRNFANPAYYRVFYLLNVVSRVPAALFFSYRAWLLANKHYFIPLTIIPLMLASVSCAIAAYLSSATLPVRLDSPERVFVIAFICTELAADFINTTTIAVGLWRSRTGWMTTDRLVSRLLIMLAETQLPPTLAALTFLIVFVGWPSGTINAAFTGISKLHVLCLMVVLNSRVKILTEFVNESPRRSSEVRRSDQDKQRVQVDVHTMTEDSEKGLISVPAYTSQYAGGKRGSISGRTNRSECVSAYHDADSKRVSFGTGNSSVYDYDGSQEC